MQMSKASSSGGIGFFGLLTVLFIGLKITHHIDWSWVWVLSPLWLGWSLLLVFILFALLMAALFN